MYSAVQELNELLKQCFSEEICTALLAKYFENEEGKHLVGPTFAQ